MTDDNFYLKTGNTGPYLERIFRDEDGDVIDLTDATNLFFKMRGKYSGETVIDSTAEFVVRVDGLVSYNFSTIDTATAGEYEGEFEVELASGDIITFPNPGYIRILIGESIGSS